MVSPASFRDIALATSSPSHWRNSDEYFGSIHQASGGHNAADLSVAAGGHARVQISAGRAPAAGGVPRHFRAGRVAWSEFRDDGFRGSDAPRAAGRVHRRPSADEL